MRMSTANTEYFQTLSPGDKPDYYFINGILLWSSTPQGHNHWQDIANGKRPIGDEELGYIANVYNLPQHWSTKTIDECM